MKQILAASVVALAVLLAGCPTRERAAEPSRTVAEPRSGALHVALLRTDLGIDDGQMVAEADSVLAELAAAGEITYSPVGAPPVPLAVESNRNDVGLPGSLSDTPGVEPPGAMSLEQAAELVGELPECDLVVACPRVLEALRGHIEAGQAVLLLDRAATDAPEDLAAEVLQLAYDVRPAAFLLGLVAGASSNVQQIAALVDATDPDADALLDAMNGGLRFRMTGAVLISERVRPGPNGVVSPEEFLAARERLAQSRAQLSVNHYIVAAGRTTPSLMYALSLDQFKVLGAWGDFRHARPSRVLACAVKHPGPALKRLLSESDSLEQLRGQFEDGTHVSSYEEGGTSITGFELLRQFTADADDLAAAVRQTEGEIRAGELDIDVLIERLRR